MRPSIETCSLITIGSRDGGGTRWLRGIGNRQPPELVAWVCCLLFPVAGSRFPVAFFFPTQMEGLEPSTSGFVGRCSIQLSYICNNPCETRGRAPQGTGRLARLLSGLKQRERGQPGAGNRQPAERKIATGCARASDAIRFRFAHNREQKHKSM